MFDWIKTHKKLIVGIVVFILQNVGIVPPAFEALSVDTKQVGE